MASPKTPTPLALCTEDGCAEPVHAKRRCSRHYGQWYRRERGKVAPAFRPGLICVECGEKPVPKGRKKTCSRKCQRARERKAYRAKLVPHTCDHCGEPFMGKRWHKNAEHQNRYCSKECEGLAKRLRFGKPCEHGYPSHSACDQCGAQYERKRNVIKGPFCRLTERPSTWRWVAGSCAECGENFVGEWHPRWPCRFCSNACINRVARRKHRAVYGRLDDPRKRARRYGVAYEPLKRTEIFERDGYCCQICGRQTLRKAKVPNPRAPTVDHIVPMSEGGDHLYINVQCACFECNWKKGAGAANDQLRLVA